MHVCVEDVAAIAVAENDDREAAEVGFASDHHPRVVRRLGDWDLIKGGASH